MVYLFLGTLAGLLWTVVALLVYGNTFNVRSQPLMWHNLTWVLLTGFLYAFLFRALADAKGTKPSNWYATAFPLVGAIARSLTTFTIGPRLNQDLTIWQDLFSNITAGYLCLGLFIVPLAVPYVCLLRRLDRRTAEWAPKASLRSHRHALFAIFGVSLILATEIPRLFELNRQTMLAKAERAIDLTLPKDAEVIYYSKSSWRTLVWIRRKGITPWPPRKEGLRREADAEFDYEEPYLAIPLEARNRPPDMVSWRQGRAKVEAVLIRHPNTDYVRYQKYNPDGSLSED